MSHASKAKPKRRLRLRVTGLALLCLCLLRPGAVHAFQNPARFFEDPVAGGSGGRFFTGSPADGFTCEVCHVPAGAVPLAIIGLPEAGYAPGQTYRITVAWQQPYENVAFNAEITDDGGRALGELATPSIDSLSPAELCRDIAVPATQVAPAGEGRSVAICGACGQQQGTFQWTAPGPGTGPAWFSGALLVSDLNGDAEGDRTAVFSRIVPPQGSSAPDSIRIEGLQAGCATGPGGTAGRASCVPLGVLLLLWRRRHSHRP